MTSPSEPNTPSSPAVTAATELPLPSIGRLVKATGMALVIAIVLLVFVVLPAEYNLDPTGFGKAIGLTRLSAPPGPPGNAATVTPAPGTGDDSGDDSSEAGEGGDADDGREDTVVIEVGPNRGLEYKFSLKAGQKMKYEWNIEQNDEASGATEQTIYYDFHGEPEGDTTGFFESYSISTATGQSGTFTAPFDGVHGWYWKNSTLSLIKITLVTSGEYEILGLR